MARFRSACALAAGMAGVPCRGGAAEAAAVTRASRALLLALALASARSAATEAPAGAPSFATEAGVITVDVVVLDKEGRPVAGLTKDDFVVSDDGRPQAITGFEPRELRAASADERPAATGAVSTNTHPPASPARVTAFIIDDLGLDSVRSGADVRKTLTRWLDERADPRDEVTLVTTSGDVWWSDTVGRGRADLLAVLERVRGRRPLASPSESMTEWEAHRIVEDGPVPVASTPRPHLTRVVERWLSSGACLSDPNTADSAERSCRSTVFMRAQQLEALTLRRQRTLLEIVERLGGAFEGRRGRKSVFILSESLIPDTPPGVVRRSIAALQLANVAVYFLDARGLVGQSFYGAEGPAAMPNAADLGMMTVEETVTATAAGAELAEATGGRLIGSTNDLFGGLSKAADESSTYYLLGYPSQGPPDGRWHKLEVKLNRPGLTVRARQGYLARVAAQGPTSDEKERAGGEPRPDPALALGPDRADVPLRLACRVLGAGEAGMRVLVGLEVGVAALTFTPDTPDTSSSGSHAVFDVTLLSIGRGRPLREDFEQRVTLRSDGTGRAPWWAFARETVLPPGATQVRVIVRDAATGRTGLVSRRFDVPEAAPEAPRDFAHAAGAFSFEARDGKRQTAVLVEVPAGLAQPAEGTTAGRLLLVVARVTDAAGKAVERLMETVSGDGPVRWRGSTTLAPGDYTLETSLLDLATGALSVGRRPFHVTASDGLTVSSVVIPADSAAAEASASSAGDPFRAGAASFWPLLDTHVGQGTPRLPILFHVRPVASAGDAPVELTLAVLRGEERLVESPLTLPAPDASGRISWMGMIPVAALPPGSYTIVARARQGGQSAEEHLTFDLVTPTAAAPTPAAATSPTASPEDGNGGREGKEAELAQTLRQAGRYVTGYALAFRDLVAEEVYEQIQEMETTSQGRRRTRADIVFVALEGAFPWGVFRDVFEVDGHAVRDREARLERLFIQRGVSALEQARAIRAESSRHNIGLARSVNEPTLPLMFLLPANQQRFRFWNRGHKKVGDVSGLEVSFEEVARPALIRDDHGEDVPSEGRFWIEPVTGAVLKSEIVLALRYEAGARSGALSAPKGWITVEYRPEASLSIWVPSDMKEGYPTGRARARYSGYRRFGVETTETLRGPQ